MRFGTRSDAGARSKRAKRGQTAVEYILMMALVAGVVVLFKNTLFGKLGAIFSATADAVATDAAYGGGSPPRQDLRGYYQSGASKATVKP